VIIIVSVSVIASVVLPASRPQGTFYSFFPFHFAWIGGIFLIIAIFWIVRWLVFPNRRQCWNMTGRGYDAHHILRERYAKGEITKEQFQQMMQDINQ
jgi:putative membrane protein